MKRRDLLALIGGAAASSSWLRSAAAEQAALRRIGLLLGNAQTDKEGQSRLAAFRHGLAALGWREGKNLRLEVRWFAGDFTRAKAQARELIDLGAEVVVVNGTLGMEAVKPVMRAIPVVFVLVGFPVGSGYVASLAHPGANVTGFSAFQPEIGGKWLQLLKEMAPGLHRVGGLLDPRFVAYDEMWRAAATAAAGLELATTTVTFHEAAEIEPAIAGFAREPAGGLVVLPTPTALAHRERIIELAAQYRLPAIYPFRYYAAGGGLMSYGIDSIDLFRRSADYVDRILNGANPGDLPVQNPSKFQLAINMKTAAALALTVPPSLLAQADEVIE